MLIIEAVSMPTIAVVHISVHVRPAFPCVVLYSCRHTDQVAAVKLIAAAQFHEMGGCLDLIIRVGVHLSCCQQRFTCAFRLLPCLGWS